MRGMIKWLPFKSLVGQEKYIDRLKEDKAKIEKPILGIDEIEEINRELISLKTGDKIKVTYFEDGRLVDEEDSLKKIDINNKRIILENNIIKINDIIFLKNMDDRLYI